MTQQPEALRIANEYRPTMGLDVVRLWAPDAVAELRRQHVEIEAWQAEVAKERERINLLLFTVREHWIKANGEDSFSVSALDIIAEVIADGSYVKKEQNG